MTAPRLQLAPDADQLTFARSFVASSLRVLGYDDDLIDDVRLAVSELLTVLLRNGNQGIEVALPRGISATAVEVTAQAALPDLPEETASLLGRLIPAGLSIGPDKWTIHLPQT